MTEESKGICGIGKGLAVMAMVGADFIVLISLAIFLIIVTTEVIILL
jgi:hypothetical protein